MSSSEQFEKNNKNSLQMSEIKNKIRITTVFKNRIRDISKPLIYDIETNIGGNPVWLIGAYDVDNKKFIQFFEKRDEKTLIEKFENYLLEHRDRTLISFSASQFEKLRLLEAFNRHHLIEETGLINNEIDLGSEVNKNIFWNFENNKLRTISSGMGFQWNTDIEGFKIGILFERYLLREVEPDWELFLNHNRDDVYATVKIFNKLKEIADIP